MSLRSGKPIEFSDLRNAHQTPYKIKFRVKNTTEWTYGEIINLYFRKAISKTGETFDAIDSVGITLESAGGTSHRIFSASELKNDIELCWA